MKKKRISEAEWRRRQEQSKRDRGVVDLPQSTNPYIWPDAGYPTRTQWQLDSQYANIALPRDVTLYGPTGDVLPGYTSIKFQTPNSDRFSSLYTWSEDDGRSAFTKHETAHRFHTPISAQTSAPSEDSDKTLPVTQVTTLVIDRVPDPIETMPPVPTQQEASAARARVQTEEWLTWMAIILPRRVAKEDLGDAIEMLSNPQLTAGKIYTKAIATIFWLGLNAFRELTSALWGRRAA